MFSYLKNSFRSNRYNKKKLVSHSTMYSLENKSSLTTIEALIGFYQFNQLNLKEDFKSHCIRVYIGCILAPIPNVKAKKHGKTMLFNYVLTVILKYYTLKKFLQTYHFLQS